MVSPEHARTMARYNAWINAKLYECCAGVGDARRKQNVGAFFKSIHGTLNHLLLADNIWMARFEGRAFQVKSLAQELHAGFDELRRARQAMDARIIDWAGALSPETLGGELRYTSIVNPGPRAMPMWLAVTHFFNHQTHHRGQLTTLLSQRGIDPGVTDLVGMPQDEAK